MKTPWVSGQPIRLTQDVLYLAMDGSSIMFLRGVTGQIFSGPLISPLHVEGYEVELISSVGGSGISKKTVWVETNSMEALHWLPYCCDLAAYSALEKS